jgi:hypothetical protein
MFRGDMRRCQEPSLKISEDSSASFVQARETFPKIGKRFAKPITKNFVRARCEGSIGHGDGD